MTNDTKPREFTLEPFDCSDCYTDWLVREGHHKTSGKYLGKDSDLIHVIEASALKAKEDEIELAAKMIQDAEKLADEHYADKCKLLSENARLRELLSKTVESLDEILATDDEQNLWEWIHLEVKNLRKSIEALTEAKA